MVSAFVAIFIFSFFQGSLPYERVSVFLIIARDVFRGCVASAFASLLPSCAVHCAPILERSGEAMHCTWRRFRRISEGTTVDIGRIISEVACLQK